MVPLKFDTVTGVSAVEFSARALFRLRRFRCPDPELLLVAAVAGAAVVALELLIVVF